MFFWEHWLQGCLWRLFLGELMSTKTIIGCVLMMAAIVISQVTFKSEERHDGSI